MCDQADLRKIAKQIETVVLETQRLTQMVEESDLCDGPKELIRTVLVPLVDKTLVVGTLGMGMVGAADTVDEVLNFKRN